ncbi:YceD family protein [Christensenella tenuis]|jgi:uncharacterized protein|uniref:DUF177 domain-containing protein n=1 Tax=Christensenella tenuis TaxID=2763033 RepID=A0ABR7EBV1_9FIRM|nr:DUF177 domain-containing protein [Christensenella tenuis]MBC5647235.1 DUF177 domain-containing protein [Christensenella tenuis]
MIEIDIREALKNEGKVYSFHYDGIPDLSEEIDFARPLVLDAEYSVLDRKVSVKGTFETALNTVCDRCLEEMETRVSYRFDETFFRDGMQEEEDYTYAGGLLSLDKMVYDAIVLSLPHQLLCSEDCKGICPACGQNLNSGSCGCKQKDTDETNPFAKLKGLF